jgi:hypothetical protein
MVVVVKKVQVLVEDALWLAVRQRALSSGVTLTEVVQRLLVLYAAEKINVQPREGEE